MNIKRREVQLFPAKSPAISRCSWCGVCARWGLNSKKGATRGSWRCVCAKEILERVNAWRCIRGLRISMDWAIYPATTTERSEFPETWRGEFLLQLSWANCREVIKFVINQNLDYLWPYLGMFADPHWSDCIAVQEQQNCTTVSKMTEDMSIWLWHSETTQRKFFGVFKYGFNVIKIQIIITN